MTTETRTFLQKYWQALAIFSTIQLILVFFGNIGAYKLNEYKVNKVESEVMILKTQINDDIKPKVNILSWMHGLDIRGETPNNNHNHKN